MNKKIVTLVLMVVLICALCLTGCSRDDDPVTDKTPDKGSVVEDVKDAADDMGDDIKDGMDDVKDDLEGKDHKDDKSDKTKADDNTHNE